MMKNVMEFFSLVWTHYDDNLSLKRNCIMKIISYIYNRILTYVVNGIRKNTNNNWKVSFKGSGRRIPGTFNLNKHLRYIGSDTSMSHVLRIPNEIRCFVYHLSDDSELIQLG